MRKCDFLPLRGGQSTSTQISAMSGDRAETFGAAVRPAPVGLHALGPAVTCEDEQPADAAARAAARADSWRALWSSRLLVWGAGVATVLLFGFGPTRGAFDFAGVTRGFGSLGDVLAAPAARWDSAWYLVIARFGYHPELGSFSSARAAFFPLYPMGLGALERVGVPAVLGGVLLSLAALWLALYGIHRLVTLELDGSQTADGRPREVARLAALLCAFAPMAFFLSAVYSEALYLALSVGLFWCARQGRWAMAGLLGGLAAASRSAGLVLVVPVLVLYLYGPREDRAPDRSAAGWLPRYRLRADALWLGLVPAGLALYLAYLGAAGGDPLTPFHAQQVWGRHFAGPYGAVWDGARAALEGARQLAGFGPAHPSFLAPGNSAGIQAAHNLMTFAFLAAALAGAVGVLRWLPRAYGLYVVAALALPLSYPASSEPLMSLPRFLVVLFPLYMWAALRLAGRPRAQVLALALSAAALVFFTAEFSTWHWVA